RPQRSCYHARRPGELPEWSNGTDSKSVVPARVPRVRIPGSPPDHALKPCFYRAFLCLPFSLVDTFVCYLFRPRRSPASVTPLASTVSRCRRDIPHEQAGKSYLAAIRLNQTRCRPACWLCMGRVLLAWLLL